MKEIILVNGEKVSLSYEPLDPQTFIRLSERFLVGVASRHEKGHPPLISVWMKVKKNYHLLGEIVLKENDERTKGHKDWVLWRLFLGHPMNSKDDKELFIKETISFTEGPFFDMFNPSFLSAPLLSNLEEI